MSASSKPARRRLHGKLFRLPAMITCDAFENFILAYLDGELAPKQRFVFEAHLRLCRECRDYLKAYRITITLAKGVFKDDLPGSPGDVPQDLIDAVLDSLGMTQAGPDT